MSPVTEEVMLQSEPPLLFTFVFHCVCSLLGLQQEHDFCYLALHNLR